MSPVPIKNWDCVLQELEANKQNGRDDTFLSLVRMIADSDWASELHGGVFLSGLLISDQPNFDFGKHMLRIEYDGSRRQYRFRYSRGPGGHKDNLDKLCSENEVMPTLDLVLKVKFGVNVGLKKLASA